MTLTSTITHKGIGRYQSPTGNKAYTTCRSRMQDKNRLNSSTGDEEPLVDAAVDRSRGKVLAGGNRGESALVDQSFGVGVGEVGPIAN